jgi:tetratricopeptide (TPR) repeat protein
MFERAMTRRGEWTNQLGQHRRMGFWGFFDRQYGFNDTLFFPIFLVGLLGLGYLFVRRRAFGAALILILLLSSVGLVWYMNFADGTKYDPVMQDAYLEVRNRDYFFTPAFILFGMAVGLGGAVLVRWLSGGAVGWAAIGATVVALLPFRTLSANYFDNDRSNNYIAYDYAYNILASADPNSVLFTNGDNDTFPVWCLQEVYGVRTDVRVANLSLLNTHWYIRQLRDELHVPMNLTDNQINRLAHYRTADNHVVRIQDQMVDEILTANNWQDTINFAVTVSQSARQYKGRPLDSHLEMIGFVQRLVKQEGGKMVDLELMEHRIDSVFKFRGLDDPTVYKDENTSRLVGNYFSTFLIVADEFRKRGNIDKAEEYAMKGVTTLPTDADGLLYLSQLYADYDRADRLDTLLQIAAVNPIDRNRVETNVALAYRASGDTARAAEILLGVLDRQPDYEMAFRTLVQVYFNQARYDTLTTIVDDWMSRHPDDKDSRAIQTQLKTLSQRLKNKAPAGDTASAETSITTGAAP